MFLFITFVLGSTGFIYEPGVLLVCINYIYSFSLDSFWKMYFVTPSWSG
jgi:hypothetical protein